jgi:hypothetical protein
MDFKKFYLSPDRSAIESEGFLLNAVSLLRRNARTVVYL